MIRPVKTYSRISTHFGDKPDPGVFGRHAGTDYACPVGTPVYAPITGKVTLSADGAIAGGQVEVTGGGKSHRMLHLSRRDVRTGQMVKEGQQIGLSGNSGSKTTGPHCHWDVRRAGTAWNHSFNDYYDPEVLLKEANQPKGGDMATLTTKADLDFLYQSELRRPRHGNEGEDVYLNKDYRFVQRDLYNSDAAKKTRAAQEARLKEADELEAQVASLKKQLAAKPTQATSSGGFSETDRANLEKIAGHFK